ncbi:DUF4179 domain-containing protein [Lysinibacillus sp. 54212]|uniref:DUF4179 domain-containing protein n=1 Tax=Lysinibacillus sp. 54212 TaxID=3119829 RepID=UPI002FC64E6D
MKSFDDNQFQQLVEELEQIDVPSAALQQAQRNAALEVQNQKRLRRRWIRVAGVAALLALCFITSIRISPAFAQAVAKIPGLSVFVEMIAEDKGIEDIIKNDYATIVGASEEKDGITFSVESVIADETGMMIAYKLTSKHNLENIFLREPKLFQNGKDLKPLISHSRSGSDEVFEVEERLEIIFTEETKLNGLDFTLNVTLENNNETTFSIPFTLTKPIAPSKVYSINKETEVDGQKISVKELVISPLRAEIKLAIAEGNTKRILQIGTMKVIDEKGEEWRNINEGITNMGSIESGEFSVFVQSNYFRKPEQLTLVLEKIEALPKGEDVIVIDFDKGEIVQQPKDVVLNVTSSSLTAQYPLSKLNHSQSLIGWELTDQNGNVIAPYQSSFVSGDNDLLEDATYYFDPTEMSTMSQPMIAKINSYPSFLQGEGKVVIDLE